MSSGKDNSTLPFTLQMSAFFNLAILLLEIFPTDIFAQVLYGVCMRISGTVLSVADSSCPFILFGKQNLPPVIRGEGLESLW